jgi:hypothetical protein
LKNLRRSCTHLRKEYLLLYLNFIIRLVVQVYNVSFAYNIWCYAEILYLQIIV